LSSSPCCAITLTPGGSAQPVIFPRLAKKISSLLVTAALHQQLGRAPENDAASSHLLHTNKNIT